jgi:FAD/FMN-containing dehydrogenase
VVIPLPRMGEYCDGIERINIELSIANKLRPVRRAERASCAATCRCMRRRQPRPDRTADRRPPNAGPAAGRRRARRWQWLLDNLDMPLGAPRQLPVAVYVGPLLNRPRQPTLFHRLQDYSVRVSGRRN